MLGPLPQRDGAVGGVGLYDALLLQAIGGASSRTISAVAQRDGDLTDIGVVQRRVGIIRAWRPGPLALRQAWLAMSATSTPGIAHIQYEAALYGSGAVSLMLAGFLRYLRKRGWRSVVTLHHFISASLGVGQMRLWKRAQPTDKALLQALRRVQVAVVRSADAIIVHEPGQVEELSASNVTLIPHMVAPRVRISATSVARDRWFPRRLVFFGFLAPYKGLPQLFEAMRILEARALPVVLDVVGGRHPRMARDPTYLGFLDGLIKAAGRVQSIKMHGYLSVPELDNVLECAHGAIFPYVAAIASSGAMAYAASFGKTVLMSRTLSLFMGLDGQDWIRRFEVTPESIAACVEGWSAEETAASDDLGRWLEARSLGRIGALHEAVYEHVESLDPSAIAFP